MLKFSDLKNDQSPLDSYRYGDLVALECVNCRGKYELIKEVLVQNLRKYKTNTCSANCAFELRSKSAAILLKCSNPSCVNEIRRTKSTLSPRNFCSTSCSTTVTNVGNSRNPRKSRVCSSCKTEFMPSKKHRSLLICLDCKSIPSIVEKAKYATKTDYEKMISVDGKHPSWVASHIRLFNRSWNKDLRKIPCQKCGYSLHVDLAHIKAVKEFEGSALMKDINDPDNILVLCKNCHWEFDHGHLKLEDIPKR